MSTAAETISCASATPRSPLPAPSRRRGCSRGPSRPQRRLPPLPPTSASCERLARGRSPRDGAIDPQERRRVRAITIRDMRVVNRTAVTITGAQPFLDWMRQTGADFDKGRLTVSIAKTYGSAFLLPEFEFEED